MTHHGKQGEEEHRQGDNAMAIVEGETSPQIHGEEADPGRTPGQAEGREEDVERALHHESGEGLVGEFPGEPGRTPGQAEGPEEDVEEALRQRQKEQRQSR